jgi:tetratricopeptide (TPR) repeat protein
MEGRAQSERPDSVDVTPLSVEDVTPIGDSAPPLPPVSKPEVIQPADSFIAEPAQSPNLAESATDPEVLQRLSDQEVKAINKELYTESAFLSDQEKQKLVRSLESVGDEKEPPASEPIDKPFGNTPIEPPGKTKPAPPDPSKIDFKSKPDQARPAMAKRQRGIAFFYRNLIQVKGIRSFQEYDELQIYDRDYVLRKKTLSPKVMIAVAAPLFAILLFIIGSQFISSTGAGEGRIIGVALDELDRPFLERADIRFPESGKAYRTDAQGFVSTENIPAGSHQIEYVVAGVVIGADYATVIDDEVTTLVLRPSPEMAARRAQSQPTSRVARAPQPKTPPSTKASTTDPDKTRASSKPTSKKPEQKSPAKLTLAANIDGATLELAKQVLGAGNLTYSKFAPGKRSYKVSKTGFETATGTITLKSGKTGTLKVELTPLTQAARVAVLSADDFLKSGLSLLRAGNSADAIADLTRAIDKKPSLAEAYSARAQAYSVAGDKEATQADYLRAAEIFQFQNDYNQAITAYNKAVEINKKSITPLLGRGNAYLARGEEIAAIADFETARKLDKKNAQARIGLGKARFNQGYYKKAIKEFKKARSMEPKNPVVHQYLMLSYMAANDVKNVKKSFEKFQKVATQDQMEQLLTDQRFVAILRIIESDS